jgi:phage shock protein C
VTPWARFSSAGQSTVAPGVWPGMNEPDRKTCPACRTRIDAEATRCPSCTQRQPEATSLLRGGPDAVLAGVCAALARRYDVDATLVRVLFVAGVVFGGTAGLWVYAALWAMTPRSASERAPLVRAIDAVGRLFSPRTSSLARVDRSQAP